MLFVPVTVLVLAIVTSSKLCGETPVHIHTQLSRIYIMSILDVALVIKCTRFSPSIVERAWVQGYMNPPATKSDKVDFANENVWDHC